MAVDCGPYLLVKEFSASLALLAAAAAWLVNRLLAWAVWISVRQLRCFELLRALKSEIASNQNGERIYDPALAKPGEDPGEQLVATLRAEIGPYKPLAPYVAVSKGNAVYETVLKDISVLPANVIGPVVRYYSASAALSDQLEDFRSDAFLALSQRRQQTVIRSLYSAIGAECGAMARTALSRISLWIWIYYALAGAIALVAAALGHVIIVDAERLWPAAAWAFRQAGEWASTCGGSDGSRSWLPI